MVHRLLFILSIVSVTLLLTSCEESATDPERQAPYDPAVPSPADGATLTSPLQYLSWNCTDPNGDALTFQVYLGTDDDPPLIAENLTSNVYFPEAVEQLTTYYWKVVATDDAGNSTTSPVWHFTITDPERQAPYEPAVPSPADGATLTSPLQFLSWNCTDPNGDALTFQVYLGTDEDPPLVAENLAGNVYFPEEVENLAVINLEKKLWEMEGLEDLYSQAGNGFAVVTAKFKVGENLE
ncbi:MAG: hypothetical protein ABH878_06185, partial [bacterium]